MIRKITLMFIVAAMAGMTANAQFGFEWADGDLLVHELDKDLKFYIDLTNSTSSNMDLRWRIMSNDFPSNNWEDYVCDILCYDPDTRAKDFTLEGDTVFPMIHYISMNVDEGYGTSTLCIWDKSDSAGTIQCLTARGATCWDLVPDTLELKHDGTTYYIIAGDVYELDGTTYTLYSSAQSLDYESCHLLAFGSTVYMFNETGFEEYDVEEYDNDGTTIYIIGGSGYTFDGNEYVLDPTISKVEFEGEDIIIIGGDSFEIVGGIIRPLGVEYALQSKVSVFPIPANDMLTISGVNGLNADVLILDLMGRVVVSNTLINQTISVSDIPSGVYTIQIESNDERALHRVSIVH